MRLEIEAEERCLGQVVRTFVHPEITEGRGDCEICKYDPINNTGCAAYTPRVVRFFDVIDHVETF